LTVLWPDSDSTDEMDLTVQMPDSDSNDRYWPISSLDPSCI
jgi:hypothetical protein